MGDVLGDPKEFAIVSLYQLLESSNIPVFAGVDEIQVIACHCCHRELCRVCSHNWLKALWRTSALPKHLVLPRMESRFQRNADCKFVPYCTTTLPVIFGWIVQ
jgi:hypothetical protein